MFLEPGLFLFLVFWLISTQILGGLCTTRPVCAQLYIVQQLVQVIVQSVNLRSVLYQWPARYPLLLIVYILFNHFNCELGAQSSVFHDVIFDNRHIHLHTTFLQVGHTRFLMSNQNFESRLSMFHIEYNWSDFTVKQFITWNIISV